MSKNILVTGSNGQLGNEIQVIAKNRTENFFFTDVAELDITNINKVEAFVNENHITTILNCAAYTAVDKAEEDTTLANLVNHTAVENLAKVSSKYNIEIVHVSTDFIFDGTKSTPYVEDDIANPLSVYGQGKLLAENAIKEIAQKAVIIRTSWVYSTFGGNFVKSIQKLATDRDSLGIIFDQVGTPTYARDLANVIFAFLDKGIENGVNIYHYSNEGVVSWYDFAVAIADISNIKCDIQPIETFQYPTPATRPKFSVMNKKKIKDYLGIKIPYWRESLEECIQALK